MSAHTPGPWTAREGGHTTTLPGETGRADMMDWCSGVDCAAPFTENEHGNYERVEEQTVANGYGKTLHEAQANARLIAAAPDLLAALEAIMATTDPYGYAVTESALAAITKARGEV